MFGRQPSSKSESSWLDKLGQVLSLFGNLCLTFFVLGVIIITIIVVTYQPDDPLFHPSTKFTSFFTSTSNATFHSDGSVLKTGEDFMASNQSAFDDFIHLKDVTVSETVGSFPECEANADSPINCTDPEVYQLMMQSAIEKFKDIHFYRFGRSVRGPNDSSCDVAWRYHPKEGKTASFYKDYRTFVMSRSENCTYSVVGIGDYHSGVNARKRKNNQKPRFRPKGKIPVADLPVVGEGVNDSLPVVESERAFRKGRYLVYIGGGDRCKSMDHYLWSLLCALGEAQYLKRTLVLDLSLCLSKKHTLSNQDEEGKDFRFYFDFEHLKNSASVLDQGEFWSHWGKWHKKNGLSLYLVEDTKTTPMKLVDVKAALIMRKFGIVEPDNYWYRVCEGETESVIQRPWHLIWKSRQLMSIVSVIANRLSWSFDSVHVVRGEKAKNTELWPKLDVDTSPENLLSNLGDKIDDGRHLYIATDEPDVSFFDPLKDKYNIHFLHEYSDLWDKNSEWYTETKKLNNGVPVEFDEYMKVEVDTEVFLRGKSQVETFNDLTSDCKNGINTC